MLIFHVFFVVRRPFSDDFGRPRIFGHEISEVSMDYDAEVEKAIGRASKCFPVFVKISIPSQAGSRRSRDSGVRS